MTLTNRRSFLRNSTLAASALALRPLVAQSTQADATVTVDLANPVGTIAPEIYSHFIEHLGGVIYDGVWVGRGSKVANVNGIRRDFIEAMRAVKAPVLRWPGGCFADSYDWRDGIGPNRPQRAAFWSQEDSNAYGTHEFMETCRAIGCEPYLAADVRSLPARDFYQWVEYCNSPAGTNALATQRAANGSAAPFNVKYWGVGNESWGCGGNMTPEEYAHEWRKFTAWTPRYPDAPLKLVACGPNGDDMKWTRGLMQGIGSHRPYGLSTHYYVSGSPTKFAQGDALDFNADQHYDVLTRATVMEKIITDHWGVLAETDKDHRVKLVIDEWGAWYSKGTQIGPSYNLSQQSTMRDALLTGITLDIFQRHADKVAMANVAQSINCIHSLMLAREDKFTVTPTFHVFQMYLPHRGAQSLRTTITAPAIPNPLAQTAVVGGNSTNGSIPPRAELAGLSGSASIIGKSLTLTIVNPHLSHAMTTEIRINGAAIAAGQGTVLTRNDIHAHNDFAHPNEVHPRATTVTPRSGRLVHSFPAASVTTLQLTLA